MYIPIDYNVGGVLLVGYNTTTKDITVDRGRGQGSLKTMRRVAAETGQQFITSDQISQINEIVSRIAGVGKRPTKTRKLKSVLESSREMLNATAKSAGDGIWRTTEDGEKIFIKDGVARGGGPNGPVVGEKEPAPGKTIPGARVNESEVPEKNRKYHVTPFANEIFDQGFKPGQEKVTGGSGNDNRFVYVWNTKKDAQEFLRQMQGIEDVRTADDPTKAAVAMAGEMGETAGKMARLYEEKLKRKLTEREKAVMHAAISTYYIPPDSFFTDKPHRDFELIGVDTKGVKARSSGDSESEYHPEGVSPFEVTETPKSIPTAKQGITESSQAKPVVLKENDHTPIAKAAKQWVEKLSDPERQSVKNWKESDYGDIRRAYATEEMTPDAKTFDIAIKKGGFVEADVYRGLSFGQERFDEFAGVMEQLGVGGVWEDVSPASASLSPRVGFNFTTTNTHKVFLKMKAKSGTYIQDPADDHDAAEQEVVTKPGAKFRIIALNGNQKLTLPEGKTFQSDLFVEMEEI